MRSQRIGRAAVLFWLLAFGLVSMPVAQAAGKDFVGKRPPEIQVTRWINTEPLTLAGLRGQVVLLEFWSPG